MFIWTLHSFKPPLIHTFHSKDHAVSLVVQKPNIPLVPGRDLHTSLRGSRGGAVVIVLASHQCGPGSNPRPTVISGLSLFLVLVLPPRVFLWVLRVLRLSSLHKNQQF